MLERRCAIALLGALAVAGCGSDDAPTAASSSGGRPDAGGCAPGEVAVDGACVAAGVPPEACGAGFVADGAMGCTATLPADACPAGQIAVPGDTACHDVAACATGPWGDIPIDATTVFVDGAYAGTDGDGSEAKPFVSIAQAIAAAPSGGLVAIAAGSYVEDLSIDLKPVRLWGRCPSQVAISGTGAASEVILIEANGAEVHHVALRGAKLGVAISASTSVLLDALWVHDVTEAGVEAVDIAGPASVTIQGSLIEAVDGAGVHVGGARITIERSAVRDIAFTPNVFSGYGVFGEPSPKTGARSNVTVRGSLIDRTHATGIYLTGSDGVIDSTLVRQTMPDVNGEFGDALSFEPNIMTGDPSAATVTASVTEQSHSVGIFVGASSATIDATVVRDVSPQSSDKEFGYGIVCVDKSETAHRGSLSLTRSLVERSTSAGMLIGAADATVSALRIRDVAPVDDLRGVGFVIEGDVANGQRSQASVDGCAVERSHLAGAIVFNSSVALTRLLVRDTEADIASGTFGDGLVVITDVQPPADVTLASSLIAHSARASITNFSSHVVLSATKLECSAIQLDGEMASGPYGFEDQGGNTCGCDGQATTCAILSASLAPPAPLPSP